MKALTITTKDFESKRDQVEAAIRDWAERECTSFDEAVERASGSDEGSIWDMPMIDSKSATGCLVDLEPLLGCKLPPSLITKGGYADVESMVSTLTTKIRERCTDAAVHDSSEVSAASAQPQLEQVNP